MEWNASLFPVQGCESYLAQFSFAPSLDQIGVLHWPKTGHYAAGHQNQIKMHCSVMDLVEDKKQA
jgi:hypothetical protein